MHRSIEKALRAAPVDAYLRCATFTQALERVLGWTVLGVQPALGYRLYSTVLAQTPRGFVALAADERTGDDALTWRSDRWARLTLLASSLSTNDTFHPTLPALVLTEFDHSERHGDRGFAASVGVLVQPRVSEEEWQACATLSALSYPACWAEYQRLHQRLTTTETKTTLVTFLTDVAQRLFPDVPRHQLRRIMTQALWDDLDVHDWLELPRSQWSPSRPGWDQPTDEFVREAVAARIKQ